MYVIVSNNRTSIYSFSCIVRFKYFLIVGVYCISYWIFQTKVYKIGSYYSVHKTKGKVGSLQKLSQFNITEVLVLCTETVNSFFHLYGCGYPTTV
jgi:hypothetical protein